MSFVEWAGIVVLVALVAALTLPFIRRRIPAPAREWLSALAGGIFAALTLQWLRKGPKTPENGAETPENPQKEAEDDPKPSKISEIDADLGSAGAGDDISASEWSDWADKLDRD